MARNIQEAILGETKNDIHNKSGGSTPTLASDNMKKKSFDVSGKKEQGSLDTLASIVTMELGSGSKKTKEAKDAAKRSMMAPSTQLRQSPAMEHSHRFQETRASLPGATAPSMSYHQQGPLSTHQSALLAARMAEEKEALALYLKQRQQHTSMELERLQQLENLRRMQTAMLLYGHAPPPQPTAFDLETLLASRRASTGSMGAGDYNLFQLGKQPGMNFSSDMGKVDHFKNLSASAAGASGAEPSLLNYAPKRSLDAIKGSGKSIKERPEEYQHLSKKAKNTPLQRAVASKFGLGSGGQQLHAGQEKKLLLDQHSGSDNMDKSVGSDDGENGHRFRPYQYEQWTEKFQELCDFRKDKGHCQVPHTYKENPPLARWVKRQRYQYKLKAEGKMSTMTDERVKLLENIGFIWDSHAAAWAEKLHELKDYLQVHGDCNVPSTYPANPQLATWVKCQRRQYKLLRDNKTSNMTVDRIMELEKLGFVWEVRKTWDQGRRSGFPHLASITAKAT